MECRKFSSKKKHKAVEPVRSVFGLLIQNNVPILSYVIQNSYTDYVGLHTFIVFTVQNPSFQAHLPIFDKPIGALL
jgi:hypothetical protein